MKPSTSHRRYAALSLCLTLEAHAKSKPRATPLTLRQQARQALNRLSFGPAPGDVEAYRQIGARDLRLTFPGSGIGPKQFLNILA